MRWDTGSGTPSDRLAGVDVTATLNGKPNRRAIAAGVRTDPALSEAASMRSTSISLSGFAQDDPRVIAALEAYLEALRAGHPWSRDEFLALHPEIAEALGQCLSGLEFIQNAVPQLADAQLSLAHLDDAIPPCAQLGEYRILREVGRGGMGVVYEAEQVSLGRHVALKVLPFAAAIDPKQRQRFQIEAQAAAQLHHPHIVPIFGVGCELGIHYYAMQFVDGRSLAAVLRELRSSEEAPSGTGESSHKDRAYCRNVARLGAEAADALEHAHGLGILHRDIKPANLLIDPDGALWITDFGLARFPTDLSLTHTGDMVGTLRYMSPEQAQARGGVVDQRTDIYALGVTLYELLTLQPAFNGRDHQELLRQIALDEPVLPRRLNPAIPRDLETVVLKAIAKDPANRYTTAQQLAVDLRLFMDDQPILARRPGRLERSLRWAHRRRDLVVTAAAILMLALIVGTATTWAQVRRTDEALRKKDADALRKKDAFFIENYPVFDHSGMDLVGKANMLLYQGSPAAAREASQTFEQALGIFQKGIELPPDSPNSREVIARAYTRTGFTRWMLSMAKATETGYEPKLMAGALADFRRSIEMLEKLRVDSHDDPRIRRYMAEALGVGGMGCCLMSASGFAAAEPLYRRAIEIRRELLRDLGTEGAGDRVAQADSIGETSNLSYLVTWVHQVAQLLDANGRAPEAQALRRQLDDDVAAVAARLSKPKFLAKRRLLADSLNHGPFPSDSQGLRSDAMHTHRLALALDPQNGSALNNLAWRLTSVPSDPWFDPAQGLALVRKAVSGAPNDWAFLNTLGVAAFRTGDWKTTTEVLHQSITFNGSTAHDLFFLAMASWHQGRKQEARKFYDGAVAWTAKKMPKDPELGRFRAEAAALLGLPGEKPKPEKQDCQKKEIATDTVQITKPPAQADRG
jgi:serine/threonine protein kinase